jgi:hypothetical protein
VNRGLPPDLKEKLQSLKSGETTFRRTGEILLQSWRDTRVVNMISTTHNLSMVGVQKRHGQVKKPANQYLAYYSLPRKTIQWTKKVALWLINCVIFNLFLIYKNLNPDSKLKYEAFLMNAAKAWATDKMETAETESDTYLVRPPTPTPHKSHMDQPG